MELEPEIPRLDYETPSPPRRTLGSRIGIGIGLSLLVWLGVDLILSVVNIWVFVVCVAIGLGFALRAGGRKHFQQLQIVLLLVGGTLAWVLLAFLFSLFSYWVIIAVTAILAAIVWYKEHQKTQRQIWLEQGRCGGCGYDLRATPDRCPECGRDTSLDEPTWRKLQREWGHIKPAEGVEAPVEPEPPRPRVPVVMKTPDFHEAVIPLEGGNSNDETSNDE